MGKTWENLGKTPKNDITGIWTSEKWAILQCFAIQPSQIPIYNTFIFLFWDLVLILRTVKGRSSWVLYSVANSDQQGDM